MNRAQDMAQIDEVEAAVVDQLMTLAAEYDGEEVSVAGALLAERLGLLRLPERSAVAMTAAMAIRLHRGGGK